MSQEIKKQMHVFLILTEPTTNFLAKKQVSRSGDNLIKLTHLQNAPTKLI